MKRDTKNVIIVSGLALEFAFMILAGALLGYFLDEKLATKPYGLAAGIFLAGLASIKIFLIIYKKAREGLKGNGDDQKDDEK